MPPCLPARLGTTWVCLFPNKYLRIFDYNVYNMCGSSCDDYSGSSSQAIWIEVKGGLRDLIEGVWVALVGLRQRARFRGYSLPEGL